MEKQPHMSMKEQEEHYKNMVRSYNEANDFMRCSFDVFGAIVIIAVAVIGLASLYLAIFL